MEWFVWLLIVFLVSCFCEIRARQAKIRKAMKYEPEPIWGASFATEKQLRQAGLFRREGSPLGYAYDSGKPLHFPGKRKVHRLTFGGSGVGKTSHLIEIAAEWPHSLVVPHDIGGELAFTTAHYRRKFGKVVIVDFYGLRPDLLSGLRRGCYNAIGPHWINPNDRLTFGPRARKAATGAVYQEVEGNQRYWYRTATEVVQTVTMAVTKHEPANDRHLRRVAEIINGDVFDYLRHIVRKTDDGSLKTRAQRWANPKAEDIRSLSEVIENTRSELEFLLDDPVAEGMRKSDFTFGDCRREVVTVYAVYPADVEANRIARLLTSCAFCELMREDGKGNVKTMVMIDEFFSLGRMDLDQVFVTARKYNCVLHLCLQDMGQLRQLHPQTHESFIGSAGVVQWLAGASDIGGSEYVSSLCGETDYYTTGKTSGYNFGADGKIAQTVNGSIGVQARRLVLPQEVRALGDREQILTVDGVKAPVLANTKPWWETSLRHKLRRNPYYRGGK
jgi:type IV secretion system protein VirD4